LLAPVYVKPPVPFNALLTVQPLGGLVITGVEKFQEVGRGVCADTPPEKRRVAIRHPNHEYFIFNNIIKRNMPKSGLVSS